MRCAALGTILALVLIASSCQREQRNPRPVAASASTLKQLPLESELVPGGSSPQAKISSPDNGNAYDISQGQTLFSAYNCAGCHGGEGGGGSGPALNDKTWLYGGEPAQIFDSIVRGRPNGMPAWGARIPEDKVWQLVAYIRSLSGEQPKAATAARSDDIEPDPNSGSMSAKEQPQ